MSTRATITVKDKNNSFHIYRHHDGFPKDVIRDITKATKFAWKFPRFEAWDFAAAIIRVMKHQWGWIYFTKSAESHWDTNYHYDVYESNGDLVIDATNK